MNFRRLIERLMCVISGHWWRPIQSAPGSRMCLRCGRKEAA